MTSGIDFVAPLPLGVFEAFMRSSFAGQAIVVLLFLASVYAWSVMVQKYGHYKSVQHASQGFYHAFGKGKHPLGLFVQRLRFQKSPTYWVYLRACEAALRVLGWQDLEPDELLLGDVRISEAELNEGQLQIVREAAERELASQVLELERDMVMLATVTAVAPFMGLLGTVWGVMEAFNGMAITGSPTLANVAPGIAAALLTTIIGLLVAIPSVIGYNVLNGMLRNETIGMDNFVQELVGEFHHCHVGRK